MILGEVIDSLTSGSTKVEQHRTELERFAKLARLQVPPVGLWRLIGALDRSRGNHAAAVARFLTNPAAREDGAFAAETAMDLVRLGDLAGAERTLATASAFSGPDGWVALPKILGARLGWNFGKVDDVLRAVRASARGKPELEAIFAMERGIAEAFGNRRSWALVNAWNELAGVLPSTFGMELFLLAVLAGEGRDAEIPNPPAEPGQPPGSLRELLLTFELSRGEVRTMVDAAVALRTESAPGVAADALGNLLGIVDSCPTLSLALTVLELARRLAAKANLPEATRWVEAAAERQTGQAHPWRQALRSLPLPEADAFKVSAHWPGRTARLSWLASRVAGSLIKNRVLRGVASKGRAQELQREEQARLVQLLTRHLGQLKGPFMKLAQQISGPILETLPPEVAADLQRLYDQSPTMPPERVHELVRSAKASFQTFDARPFAAGSVGQVHAATLSDGTRVAVKLQFEGIGEAARIDMSHLRRAIPLLRRFFPRANVEELIDEWAEMLESEVDYRREIESMATFAELWREFPGIVVPQVHAAQSGDRVITMDFLAGQRLTEFAATATQDERNHVAQVILRSTWHAIIHGGVFNVDPHQGNYVVMGDRIGCLDFGRVKKWAPEFVKDWASLITAAVQGDMPAFRDVHTRMGFAGDKSFDLTVAFETFRRTEAAPFIGDHFTFRPGFVRDAFRTSVIENANLLHYRVPRDYLMATRMHFGLFHILEILGADGAWWDVISDLLTGVPDPSRKSGS